jgi:hypothetical protein
LYYPAADVHLIGPQLVEVQQADVGLVDQVDWSQVVQKN